MENARQNQWNQGIDMPVQEAHIEKLMQIINDMIAESKMVASDNERARDFFRRVLDAIPHLIYVKNWEGQFTLVNKSLADILGTTVDNLTGKTEADFNANQEKAALSLKKDREVMETLDPIVVPEEPVRHAATGEMRWFKTIKTPLISAGGAVRQALSVSTDITDWKIAQDNIRRRFAFERLITSLSSQFIDLAPEHAGQAINEALKAIGRFSEIDRAYIFQVSPDKTHYSNTYEWCETGIKPAIQQLQNVPFQTFPWVEDNMKKNKVLIIPRVKDLPSEAAAEKQEFEHEGIQAILLVPLIYKNDFYGFLGFDAVRKEINWPEETVSILKIVGEIFINVMERTKTESKLAEQASLLDKTQDAIVVTNLEGKILFWNHGAEQICGWKKQDIIGKNIIHDICRSEAQSIPKDIMLILRDKGTWSGEIQHATKNDQKITMESRWTLVQDKNGRASHIMIINTDITEKKRIEAQYLRAQRMESIGTLAGGIAHDLNNVLSPIVMAIPIFRRGIKDKQLETFLDLIESSTQRGVNLVKQVLAFSRGVSNDRQLIQTDSLLKEMSKIIAQTFPKSIDSQIHVTEDLKPVEGDPTQIHQIIMNLCVNARDAMPDGGRLQLSAENIDLTDDQSRQYPHTKPGLYVALKISDTGQGMPPKLLEKIFDPFFTTKEEGKGTGLGLFTVDNIVRKHKGFLTVTSEEGHGTQFTIYLPATDDSEINIEKPDTLSIPPGHGELLLVVDDESSIREITKSALITYGYRVITAKNGAESVDLLAKNKEPFDLIILDMGMPVMDGRQTMTALQKINPHIKVIACSGTKDNENIASSESSCVKAFLQKPISSEKMLLTVHQVLKMEHEVKRGSASFLIGFILQGFSSLFGVFSQY